MLSKIFSTAFSRGLIAICGLIILILNTRYLGPRLLGELSLVLLGINLLTQISELIGGATLVLLQRKYPISELLLPSYLWGALVSLVGSVVFLFFAQNSNYFLIFVSISTLQNINHAHLHMLVGKRKIFSYNLLSLVNVFTLLAVLLAGYLLYNRIEISTFLVAYFVGQFILFLLSIFLLLNSVKEKLTIKFNSKAVNELIKKGFLLQSSNVLQFGVYRLNYLIVEILLNTSSLGLYVFASQITEKARIPGGAISTVQYSEVANSEDQKKNIDLTLKMLTVTFVVTVLSVLFIVFIPKELVLFVFGEKFGSAQELFMYFGPGIILLAMSSILSHYFAGIGKFQLNTLVSGIGLMITLVIAYPLIVIAGIQAAALSLSVVFALQFVFNLLLFKRQVNLSFSEIIGGMVMSFKLKGLFQILKKRI